MNAKDRLINGINVALKDGSEIYHNINYALTGIELKIDEKMTKGVIYDLQKIISSIQKVIIENKPKIEYLIPSYGPYFRPRKIIDGTWYHYYRNGKIIEFGTMNEAFEWLSYSKNRECERENLELKSD